jgi:hypothetical protein
MTVAMSPTQKAKNKMAKNQNHFLIFLGSVVLAGNAILFYFYIH